MIKLQWIGSIWCQNDQNNAKLQTRSNYDQFASIWHLNYQKCWVTSQNIQNNAKLRKWSNYNGLHRFDGKNIKPTQNYKQTRSNYDQFASIWRQRIKTIINVVFRRKTIKKPQNYEYDQIIMNCIDLTSKRSKMFKTFNTTQNNKSDQITTNCIDLMSEKIKTTQNYESDHIIIIASIWRQNHQNFWVRWQNYKSNQITMNCIDLMSKRSKMLSYVAQHSKQRKTTKLIKL